MHQVLAVKEGQGIEGGGEHFPHFLGSQGPVEKKLGKSLDEIFPKPDYQIMHTLLFPHDIIHIENLGGQIDEVLDQKIQFGCFPWRFQGGEAALCRAVAILDE